MALEDNARERNPGDRRRPAGWGGKLFVVTLIAVLAFFWWLLIYSGGVAPHHG
ncbi:MAG: hypothetical protein OES38_22285 [Gammaproteobacteria bacterium]|nr:hypothetical protein [Gammaproteobacteria bacterium]